MPDNMHITVGGAPEGYDATLILAELKTAGVVCHVARDDKRMRAGGAGDPVPGLGLPSL